MNILHSERFECIVDKFRNHFAIRILSFWVYVLKCLGIETWVLLNTENRIHLKFFGYPSSARQENPVNGLPPYLKGKDSSMVQKTYFILLFLAPHFHLFCGDLSKGGCRNQLSILSLPNSFAFLPETFNRCTITLIFDWYHEHFWR